LFVADEDEVNTTRQALSALWIRLERARREGAAGTAELRRLCVGVLDCINRLEILEWGWLREDNPDDDPDGSGGAAGAATSAEGDPDSPARPEWAPLTAADRQGPARHAA
jgi:hypothetical protein